MKDKTIRLITCNDSFRAHIIKGALENEGIKSVLYNVNSANAFMVGIDIFVFEKDFEKAVAILNENGMING